MADPCMKFNEGLVLEHSLHSVSTVCNEEK